MMNFKRLFRTLAAMAVLLLAVLLIACQSDEPAPDAIYFAKEYTPRKNYVQGQDLDFSNILLTCEVDGEYTTVEMTAEGVTVSGYDKNLLGEQTVTVSYKEQVTSFQVNVIPRIAAEGFDANYFVGDVFNKQNGRIKVADNQANVTTVNLKDEAVTVSNFDSSTAGTKTVTVSYKGYTGTFQVNVLGVERVKLNAPSKKSYQSHETEFNVVGGYFTVVSENSVIQKTVPITVDMVTGFDPTVATIENRTAATAVKQTVEISYLGYAFDMEISIRYSGVSIVKAYAKELASIDNSKPISDEVGAKVMDAMNEYLDLSKAEQALITADEIESVARTASIYAYGQFVEETAKYSHTFKLEEGESTDEKGELKEYCGYFTVSCEEYDSMMETLEALKDKNSDFNTLADFLHALEKEFKDLEVTEGVKTDAYFKTLFLADDLTYVTDLFKQMTAIYEELTVVPEVWDKESIKDAAMVEGIEGAYLRISTSNFNHLNYPAFYNMISTWREKNDFYEILHTHYLYNKTYSGENESYTATVWEKIPFPAQVQELYETIASGYTLSQYMSNNVYDTTTFMIVYRDAVDLAEEIKSHENTLYGDIYEAIDFDDLIDGYLYSASRTGLYGFLDVIGNLNYNKELLTLIWDDYFAIVDLAGEDGTVDFEDPATVAAVQKMFDDFFGLTPFERYQIICTLYSNYGQLNVEGYAFDYSEGITGTFINLFAFYYAGEDGVLPESTHVLFQKLMITTEQYGIRYKYLTVASEALGKYSEMMDEIVRIYNALSPEDRDVFNQYVGAAYQANVELYETVQKTAPELSTYPLLEELKAVLESYYEIMAAISMDEEAANKNGTYALLFATYEKANALRREILASDDAALIEAYRSFNYIVLNTKDKNAANDYSMTLEAIFDAVKAMSYGYTLTVTKDDETKISYNAVEYYTEAGLADFLADSYKVLYAQFKAQAHAKEDVLALMEKYRGLDVKGIGLFYSLNLDELYYAAIDAFHASALANDANTAALATALKEAEQAYADYATDTEDAEKSDAFREAWQAVETAKIALGTSLDNYNELLQAMYEYYLAAYTEMTENV